ncbi:MULTISPECIES: hypothetical protein [Streptomyces]|uniref:Uncharacterized protein n=1 Tax=Streptomyces albus (strain ATCC 21838 / DSM 41398 / FERM P-419 / JCM 4703 / NBRC 107858) TaxID=1081613 RepID=A0A0B5ERG2_STRA4|nr:hypothetical protein [Streptomyces sp. SCSIO ZS0520]AJE81850.1 hypothetical protein SLNWT_1474 [Streptomyces albus]AOU76166.1 hypothetical protein SLNHY_1475 [Streptomyces albus]AYN31957.1 hypothetical protein DUI70_1454 [Streptomyces albus]
MDYCDTCRRTLNGALVCPGCGAYAPDIAPYGSSGAAATAATAPYEALEPSAPAEHFDFPEPAAEAAAETSGSTAAHGRLPEPAAASGLGRAARRRQQERWRKNKRRAAAATAFAFIGGGFTIAALPGKSAPGSSHAATPPEPVTAPSTGTPGSGPSATQEPDSRTSTRPVEESAGHASEQARSRPGQAGSPSRAHRSADPQNTPSAKPSSATPERPEHTDPAPTEEPPQSPGTTPPPTAPPTTPPPSTTEPSDPPATDPSGICVLFICID